MLFLSKGMGAGDREDFNNLLPSRSAIGCAVVVDGELGTRRILTVSDCSKRPRTRDVQRSGKTLVGLYFDCLDLSNWPTKLRIQLGGRCSVEMVRFILSAVMPFWIQWVTSLSSFNIYRNHHNLNTFTVIKCIIHTVVEPSIHVSWGAVNASGPLQLATIGSLTAAPRTPLDEVMNGCPIGGSMCGCQPDNPPTYRNMDRTNHW